MRPHELEAILHSVEGFDSPKIQYEQYETSAHLASQIVMAIDELDGLDDSSVLDLGVGTGRLAIGCVALNASYVLGVDIDQDALNKCAANRSMIQESEEDDSLITCLDLIQADVSNDAFWTRHEGSFDIIVMNPPFGTKATPGIDMLFLRRAIDLRPKKAIYSLHKTSTRDHILKRGKEWDMETKVVATLRWDLPKTYKFQKLKSKDIQVDLFRFENKK